MGNSKPPKAQFDLIGSYARRRGNDVEIVLADPVDEISSVTEFTLRRAGRDITVPVSLVGGSPNRLVGRLPRTQLSDGIWNIRRDAAGGDEFRLGARLLVQGERPLVLLLGAEGPRSVVPKARPVVPVPSLARRVVRRLTRAVRR